MSVDFIPHPDGAFDHFYRNLTDYVIDNNTRWGHIPQDYVGELEDQFTQWSKAYEATLVPHSPPLTLEKNRVRQSTERALRAFINRFLRWPPVTALDRDKMGVRNWSETRTPHIDVTEVVEYELRLNHIREVVINFWVKGQTNMAKPQGYDGAVLVWGIFDSPPANVNDLGHHTMASRTPHTITFEESERGKSVYIALTWQNERGHIGNWSEIQHAIIP
jgi:hypothetical protein